MKEIKIIIADSSYIARKGLSVLLSEKPYWNLVAEAENSKELFEKIKLHYPDVIIIDYSISPFNIENVIQLLKKYPSIKILAITREQSKFFILKAFEYGVISHLLKDCDKDEISEAIDKTAAGDKFVCGKILDKITSNDKEGGSIPSLTSCDGVNVTDREMEIIKLIAEGYSNKQVADKLFLSTHTVTTHRKNIMSKLGVNNTAGLVLFAVRENILNPNKFLFS